MNINSATPHALLTLLVDSDPAQEPWFFWVDHKGEIYLESLPTYGLNFARWEKILGHRSQFHFGTLPPGCVGPDTRDDLALAQGWLARLSYAWEKGRVGYVSADFPSAGRQRRLTAAAPSPSPPDLRRNRFVGERGTGKTTLANALRAMSRFQRADARGRPLTSWPAVVCGQFKSNPQLARGELFGYKKGAFTGADRDHMGLLEQADGDSLFLDEIADLDRDTQRLLMAALEGRPFRRMGDTVERSSRFRLICATNQPLDRLQGEVLDKDFYDRVSVFVLHVPPLRACREDLPTIWRGVWRRIATESALDPQRSGLGEHGALLDALARHPLPGNLRDLQRLAWHLAAHHGAGDPPDRAVEEALGALDPGEGSAAGADRAARLPLSAPLPELLRAERQAWVAAALAKAGGNQSEAARCLGVKRETFKEWARELGGDFSPEAGDIPPSSSRPTEKAAR